MTSPVNIRGTSPSLYSSDNLENAATGNVASTSHYPPQLYRSRINDASLLWVKDYKNSADPAEVNIATTALKAIESNALSLGNPKAQSEKKAQYGANLRDSEEKYCTLLANFRPNRTGDFNLTFLAMLDAETREKIELMPPRPTIESADQETYDKNESLATVGKQQDEKNKSLLIGNKKTIKILVSSLNKWEQKPCLELIKQKLHTIPLSQQQLLLQSLTVRLSNMNAAEKRPSIEQWAKSETADKVLERRDQRSLKTKQLQDKLSNHLKDPQFLELHDEICNSLPLEQRSHIRCIKIASDKFASPLYSRVFSGTQPPIDNMRSIKDCMNQSASLFKYNALLGWKSK